MGDQIKAWNRPFTHQTAVIRPELFAPAIARLQRPDTISPVKTIFFGARRSPKKPLTNCPAP